MTSRDGQAANDASIGLLDHTTRALRSVNGPISAGTAAAALVAVTSVIRSRQRPVTPKALDAIMALIEAVREEITAQSAPIVPTAEAMREEAERDGD